MSWMALIYPVTVFVVLLIGAYGWDTDGKYRRVVINVLTEVKKVTPDNVDEIIDLILAGLEAQGLNPESKRAKKMIAEVRKEVALRDD